MHILFGSLLLTSQREKSSDAGSSSSGGSLVATGSSGVGVVTSVGVTSASSSAMASSLASGLSSGGHGGHGGHMGEEPSDLEELEQFARTFKQRRIKLGFTQVRRRKACLHDKVCMYLHSDTNFLSPSGRCWCGYGKTVRQRFQPDHHLPLWSSQPEL